MQLHTADSEILQTISTGEVFGWLSGVRDTVNGI